MKTKQVTIIVPVYNEELRIKPFIKALLNFSKNLKDYEIIFIDDGSTDKTLSIIQPLENENIKFFSLKKNQGKGAAVKLGVEKSKGKQIVFIDADNSVNPKDIKQSLNLLKKSDVVIGDRYEHRENIKQPRIREFAGNIFNSYVNLLFNLGVKDTLCGIKAFRRKTALELFKNLKSERWEFDVEILYYIKKKKFKLVKMPISWEYKSGTKMKITDPLKMSLKLLILRLKT